MSMQHAQYMPTFCVQGYEAIANNPTSLMKDYVPALVCSCVLRYARGLFPLRQFPLRQFPLCQRRSGKLTKWELTKWEDTMPDLCHHLLWIPIYISLQYC